MSTRRLLIGLAVLGVVLVVGALLLGAETGWYTMTVNADISAGVSRTSSCTIVSSERADHTAGPVISIRPVVAILMFHSEALGEATVHCGALGEKRYTCGGTGPASFNATATAEGTATVEAVIGDYARGTKTVTVIPAKPKP